MKGDQIADSLKTIARMELEEYDSNFHKMLPEAKEMIMGIRNQKEQMDWGIFLYTRYENVEVELKRLIEGREKLQNAIKNLDNYIEKTLSLAQEIPFENVVDSMKNYLFGKVEVFNAYFQQSHKHHLQNPRSIESEKMQSYFQAYYALSHFRNALVASTKEIKFRALMQEPPFVEEEGNNVLQENFLAYTYSNDESLTLRVGFPEKLAPYTQKKSDFYTTELDEKSVNNKITFQPSIVMKNKIISFKSN